MQTLLQIFQDAKEVLCRYDYYIHTQNRILHITNSEVKIPHLMGMQYLGKHSQFTGDFGAYAIKKQRITMESVENLVRKYYKTEEKQRRMLEIIHRKLDNLNGLGKYFLLIQSCTCMKREKIRNQSFRVIICLCMRAGRKSCI